MHVNEPLVVVKNSEKLIVEPIWEKPVEELEGFLYQQYIRQNPGYTQVLIRKTASRMLQAASLNLPDNYQLIVRSGHRPLTVQQKLLEAVREKFQVENVSATTDQALEFARTFVSDPSTKLPPHCCGAAVDVDMIDNKTGKLVDFGCSVNTTDDIAFLSTNKINSIQQANRQVLIEAMVGAGFATFEFEWWHFSYGDQNWADYYQKSGPIYGLIEA